MQREIFSEEHDLLREQFRRFAQKEIEPKVAELKHLHGLARARYWTLPRMKIQLHLAVIAANVKRIVKLLFEGAIPPAAALGGA